jgi:hypothetical protein
MLTAVVGDIEHLSDSNAHRCVHSRLIRLQKCFGHVLHERIEQLGHKQVRRGRQLPKLVGRYGAGCAVRVRGTKHNLIIGERETMRTSENDCSSSGGTIHTDDVTRQVAHGTAARVLNVESARVRWFQLSFRGHHVAGVIGDFFERPMRNTARAMIVA